MQSAAGVDSGVVKQHRSHQAGAPTQQATVAQPGGTFDARARFDAAARANVDRAFNVGAVPVDAGVQPDPDPRPDLATGHAHVAHPTGQDTLQHAPVVAHAANVDPVEGAVLRKKGQALLHQQWKELTADVELFVAGNQLQHCGFDDVNAGAGQGRAGLLRRGLFLEGFDATLFVGDHDAVVLDLITRHVQRHHTGHGLFLSVFGQRRANVQVDDGVAAQHQGGLVKKTTKVLDVAHAAGRAQRPVDDLAVLAHALIAVADGHAPAVAIAKVVFDFPVVVSHVDHDLAHVVAREVLDDVFQNRLAQDRDHGLGRALGQRPDAGALAGGQDHGFGHDGSNAQQSACNGETQIESLPCVNAVAGLGWACAVAGLRHPTRQLFTPVRRPRVQVVASTASAAVASSRQTAMGTHPECAVFTHSARRHRSK